MKHKCILLVLLFVVYSFIAPLYAGDNLAGCATVFSIDDVFDKTSRLAYEATLKESDFLGKTLPLFGNNQVGFRAMKAFVRNFDPQSLKNLRIFMGKGEDVSITSIKLVDYINLTAHILKHKKFQAIRPLVHDGHYVLSYIRITTKKEEEITTTTYLIPFKISDQELKNNILGRSQYDIPHAGVLYAQYPGNHSEHGIRTMNFENFANIVLFLTRKNETLRTALGGQFIFRELKDDSHMYRVISPDGQSSNLVAAMKRSEYIKFISVPFEGESVEEEMNAHLLEQEFRHIPREMRRVLYQPPGKSGTETMLIATSFEKIDPKTSIVVIKEPENIAYTFLNRLIDERGKAGFKLSFFIKRAVSAFRETFAKLPRNDARLHIMLARETEIQVFKPEPLTEGFFVLLKSTLLKEIEEMYREIEKINLDSTYIQRLKEAKQAILSYINDTSFDPAKAGFLIRIHGDINYGQHIRTEDNDFMIADFGGEPLLSMEDRRQKQSPLKDVAGMLRSFSYSVYAVIFDFIKKGKISPKDFPYYEEVGLKWLDAVSKAYLEMYLTEISYQGMQHIIPQGEFFETLLNLYIIKKAFYELRYEMNLRPDWLPIPVNGILTSIPHSTP